MIGENLSSQAIYTDDLGGGAKNRNYRRRRRRKKIA